MSNLILSRQVGQSFIIGSNDIEITIVDVHNGKVKLGIRAPSDMPVNRGEIYQSIVRDGHLVRSVVLQKTTSEIPKQCLSPEVAGRRHPVHEDEQRALRESVEEWGGRRLSPEAIKEMYGENKPRVRWNEREVK